MGCSASVGSAAENVVCSDYFGLLESEILVKLGMFLDDYSFVQFISACSRFSQIEIDRREHIWSTRILSKYGTLNLGAHGSWKLLATQLHQGVGVYRGFCLDAFTSDFNPYPMEVHFSRDPNDLSRMRWRTLGDAVTRLNVRERVRDSTRDLTSMTFVEEELLHGENILVPNAYYGYCQGPCLLGVFPNGAFYSIRSEAIERARPESPSSHDFIKSGTVLNGFSITEHMGFNSSQGFRLPIPRWVSYRLEITEAVPSLQCLPFHVSQEFRFIHATATDTHISIHKGELSFVVTNGPTRLDSSLPEKPLWKIAVYLLEDKRPSPPHDFIIFTTGVAIGKGNGYAFAMELLSGVALFGWKVQGTHMVGVQKNETRNTTGAFFLSS